MTTNESDVRLDAGDDDEMVVVVVVVVVDETCEAGLGVSCQICGAGRCTT